MTLFMVPQVRLSIGIGDNFSSVSHIWSWHIGIMLKRGGGEVGVTCDIHFLLGHHFPHDIIFLPLGYN